ncbi:pyruvate dehydrogenase complex dihydrolipoamide acetyltransferase [Candidatus Deianiraea vastatrix]|uniref:Acetyltransferase component of pyruvate dehydrogenase complex n=1 Tax=Candidatus Deianiraea vastatrix TaxID=2163644 RepID=A0A5B8XFV0_9RICK|nr:pyruvate dehydrogenase complex dihydrolipoamide acetyltransferase [Candidatus Deianiraea vastatrix]QED22867.1 Dihydrolipoyllysine-residue acetyltransferase E2 component of pyruvate dehydrogenase complex [Candidatus Deianiraea vastatrix]
MPIEILMPALSPTMKEGNLAKWAKKEGEEIKSGQMLAEIETDKAMMEVESIENGTLGKILVAGGTSNVKVNTVIGLILEKGEDKSVLDTYQIKGMQHGQETQKQPPVEKEIKSTTASNQKQPLAQEAKSDRIYASPLAKNIAANNGVDISKIQGTGPHGRVVKRDVECANVQSFQTPCSQIGRNQVEYTDEKVSTMRNVIAQRLQESKQNVPHFYLSCDCVVDNLLLSREMINSTAPKDKDGKPAYKISVNDLVVKLTAMAIRNKNFVNASWMDGFVRQYNNIDISIAVSIPDGLITPIVKNADQKGVLAISADIKDLASRARKNQLKLEEFQGGGFSISNLGMYGIESFNAIVNPPQACILAVGAVIQKPVVKSGQIEVANVMNISISVDHRVIDGAKAAEFLSELKNLIENPILGIL